MSDRKVRRERGREVGYEEKKDEREEEQEGHNDWIQGNEDHLSISVKKLR